MRNAAIGGTKKGSVGKRRQRKLDAKRVACRWLSNSQWDEIVAQGKFDPLAHRLLDMVSQAVTQEAATNMMVAAFIVTSQAKMNAEAHLAEIMHQLPH